MRNMLYTSTLILLFLAIAVPGLVTPVPAVEGHSYLTMTAYHGSLHNHTGYSDGVETPDVAFTAGRERGMDFMAVTDHSEMTDDAEWLDTLAQAESHTVDGVFVALRGTEYTNNQEGHLNVYDTIHHPSYTYTGFTYADHVGPLAGFYLWMGDHPEAVGQFNHPGWKNFNDWEYHGVAEAGMQLLEVGCCTPPNYVWDEGEYISALEHGWRVAPTISADTHTDQWGIDLPGRTGIWASELTYDGVIEALRAMRVFATEDGNFEFYLQLEGDWMGTVVPNDGQIDVQVYVFDPNDESLTALELYTNNGQLVTWVIPPNNPFTWSFSLAIGEGTRYYYARAVQADGDQSVTAPVWTESPVTGLQAHNDGPTALGQPTTLMATVSGGSSVSYAWSLGDGTRGQGNTLVHTYPAAGTYTAVVTASNHVSLLTATTTVVIEEAITPTAAFTATTPVCEGQETWLYFTGDPGLPVADQYTWWFGDGMGMTVGTPDPVTHLYAPGTYTATLEVCNQVVCDTAEGMVQVDPLPVASFTYAVDELSATFTDTAMYATSWLWDFSDGVTDTVQHPVHTYTIAGTYTVTQYAYNDCGTDLVAYPVAVGVAPTAAFTHNAPVCLGAVVTLTNETTGTAPLWYTWDWGDGGTSTETNPVHLYAAAGRYTVTLDAQNDFGADQALDGVEVRELPLAAFTYTLKGLEVTFVNLSAGADDYLWELGDGGNSTETNPVYTYAGAGTYTVTLEITGPCGDDSTETAITVKTRDYLIYLPLVWRPAGR